MPGSHALLSPSAAHRWLNCTPSVRLEEGIEDKGSDFAAEGTLAHAICEQKLLSILGRPHEDADKEIADLSPKYHSGEMDEYTDTYRSIVMEKLNAARVNTPDAQLLVEVRLDFRSFLQDSFGTADAVIIADDLMEIIDFKYGKGVKVSAFQNPQMRIYALGALDEFLLEYNIKRVRMTIVQPRIDNLSEDEMPVSSLLKWRDEILRPASELAFRGEGEQKPGEWCRFCKVKASCKALATLATKTCNEDFKNPRLISDEDIPKLLPLIPVLKSWMDDFTVFSLERAMAGAHLEGYKVVEGRSVRQVTDQDGLVGILTQEGFDRDILFRPAELKTLGDLEKIVGKKKFADLSKPYVTKPQGKPALVELSDKRPPLPLQSANDDFKELNTNS